MQGISFVTVNNALRTPPLKHSRLTADLPTHAAQVPKAWTCCCCCCSNTRVRSCTAAHQRRCLRQTCRHAVSYTCHKARAWAAHAAAINTSCCWPASAHTPVLKLFSTQPPGPAQHSTAWYSGHSTAQHGSVRHKVRVQIQSWRAAERLEKHPASRGVTPVTSQ